MAKHDLDRAIAASIENGDRLTEDAKTMLEYERVPTAYALALLAQEEYAKSLILDLAKADAIPWSGEIRRALRDHVCKQLVAVILDYLSPDDDEFFRRTDPSRIAEEKPLLPPSVLDAIHTICHERIPREWDRWWVEPGDRPLDNRVQVIADGGLDQQKQDALYVRLGKKGGVASEPALIPSTSAILEVERSERIGRQLRMHNMELDLRDCLDFEKLIALFKLLTGRLSPEAFNANWWARSAGTT